jgi:hypothetical protein
MRWKLCVILVAIASPLFGFHAESQGVQFIDRNPATDAYERGMQAQQEQELLTLRIEMMRRDLEQQRALQAERQRMEADLATSAAAKAAPVRKKAKPAERSTGQPPR